MAKAIIVGASGLIGGELLDILLQSPAYKDVTILVRRELSVTHSKLKQVLVDFDKLNEYKKEIDGHALFCCLGSTNKKTPNRADYRKIDHDYPLQLALMAAKNKMPQYHLVSALGANVNSSNFYTKMKGETEEDIKKTGVNCLHIYRPALLTGNRKERRVRERIFVYLMKVIDLFLWGRLRKYRSIPAKTVAMAMYKQSLIKQEGVFTHLSDEIKELS